MEVWLVKEKDVDDRSTITIGIYSTLDLAKEAAKRSYEREYSGVSPDLKWKSEESEGYLTANAGRYAYFSAEKMTVDKDIE